MILEGRDKFVKILQYFAKLCAWFHLRKNAELSINYLLMAQKISESR